MTRVYLVRHGETVWNLTKRAQGHADVPLNAAGRRQARLAAAELDGVELDAVYASDLARAVDTATPIARAHDLEVTTDPDLREIDQGEWEGLTTDEIKRRWPHLWGAARHHRARPGGESPGQVRARSLEALRRIVAAHPDGAVAVVSHGGTIRWLSAEALGYDDRRSARLRGVSNGGVVSLQARVAGDSLVLDDLVRLDGAAPDQDDPNA